MELPVELIAEIFTHLVKRSIDVNNVRLVCTMFRAAAVPVFAQTFNHRVFHLHTPSIESLLKLATDPKMARHIEQLNFSTVSFTYLDHSLMSRYEWASNVPTRREAGFKREVVEWYYEPLAKLNDDRTNAYTLRADLAAALRKLPKLTRIVIVDGHQLTHIHGLPGVHPFIQQRLQQAHQEGAHFFAPSTHERALELLIEGIHTAAISDRLQSLHIEAPFYVNSLPCPTFRNPHTLEDDQVFRHLTHLVLYVDLPSTVFDTNGPFIPATNDNLPIFLRGFPALKHFELHLPLYTDPTERRRYLLPWVDRTGFPAVSRLTFPHLQSCKFSNLETAGIVPLRRFLLAHSATLRTVAFWNLRLPGSQWRPFAELVGGSLELDLLEIRSLKRQEDRGLDSGEAVSRKLMNAMAKVVRVEILELDEDCVMQSAIDC
ncbi:hypothetical protein B0A50_02844 [Salinomyces thailandicus]|uniref:F-box domain-containing protein n=1 Tax=Salinomyces thailandicus TaxID=706561 RepID=A0A4U0U7C7_9PEZI|nr:hypothetical protein B0A50_02844 [Salinomyces thailandica]